MPGMFDKRQKEQAREESRCRSCGNKLGLLQRLSGQDFCSAEHRIEYHRSQDELALARLQQSAQEAARPREALPIEEEHPETQRLERQPAAVGQRAEEEVAPREAGLLLMRLEISAARGRPDSGDSLMEEEWPPEVRMARLGQIALPDEVEEEFPQSPIPQGQMWDRRSSFEARNKEGRRPGIPRAAGVLQIPLSPQEMAGDAMLQPAGCEI